MMIFGSTQKIILAVSITLGLVGMLLGGAVYPIFTGIVYDHAQVLKHRDEIVQMNEDGKQMREFDRISTQYANEFLQAQTLFVDNKTPVSFFRFLDQSALKFGLKIQKTPDNPRQRKDDAWPSLDVRMIGKGSYSNVLAFLQTIENAPYLLEVQTLRITKSNQNALNEEIEFVLSLKVFVRDFAK